MKKWLFAIVLVSLLALAACGGGGGDESKESDDSGSGDSVDATKAEEVFKSNCASCHANDLSGKNGPSLKEVGKTHSKDEISDIIENGKEGGMPAGLIDGDEKDTVASWLADHK